MDVLFSAISTESSGCMVQCSEGPGSPTYMTPMPSVLIFIAIRLWWWQHPKSFIVYDDDNMLNKCVATASKLTIFTNSSSHEFSVYQGVHKYFENIHIWNAWPLWKGRIKEFWTSLGLCKISSFSAISAQVVAKSFHQPATKICWYPLFSQSWLSSKNGETLGKNTWNTFLGNICHIRPRCGQSLIVWWRFVGSDIRCQKGKQAITSMYW